MATEPDERTTQYDVAIVGGGVAGLSAGLFTARADLATLVVDHGGSILKRNAHLTNYPGFPAGINPRLYVEMLEHQADRAGCERVVGKVTDLNATDDGFTVEMTGRTFEADRAIAASWADTDFLDGLDLDLREEGTKQFVQPDETGHTNVDGLYAAGRLAEQYHQAIVAAGHGAQVGITVVNDADSEFYNDWVAPEGYFTNRGHEVPEGCVEIDAEERRRRERESLDVLREYIAEPHADRPATHPDLEENR